MRAAVYSGTRNIYQNMVTAAKSLLQHSNVEKIYFLIEDDVFPYELPQEFQCINVSNQTYFPSDGPNFNNVCTYMVLIRAAYPKIFPDLDRILSIDMDAIVNENISQLWDLDLTDYYLAAVRQHELSKTNNDYINMGVAMFNLKKMRQDKKDDQLIKMLNTYFYRFKEQDCFNQLFKGKILILPSDYNVCIQSDEPYHEKITHFAGIYHLDQFPHFDYYKNLSFDKLKRNKKDNITLDIIIPTYKNKTQLRRTLNSIIPNKKINVLVIDDNSNEDYTDIIQEYPFIKFYALEQNVGPGMVRQYGIEHSNGTYITFLDTGDYFYTDGIETILNEIEKNTYIKMYTFSYVYDNNNILDDKPGNKTIGSVYKRSFIQMYNISFCKEGSYANEDYSFSRACQIIILNLQQNEKFHKMHKHIYTPAFYEHIDKNSTTKRNNNEFFYTKLPQGIIINDLHAIKIAKAAHVKLQVIVNELCRTLAWEYYFFVCAAQGQPEIAENTWKIIREFYLKYCKVYDKVSEKFLQNNYKAVTLTSIKRYVKVWRKQIPLNINRFIHELDTEENIPIRYLT